MRASISLAAATLLCAARDLPMVSLAEVLAQAELQTRVDRKYLVPRDRFGDIVAGLNVHVLEIEDRRLFRYESVYFDTPDLVCYRAHIQGQRRRFKVRTRTYLDSGECALEVKTKGGRSETVKHRRAHPMTERYALSPDSFGFLASRMTDPATAPLLRPTLVTTYRRLTLVDMVSGARLTCDVDLRCTSPNGTLTSLSDHILVETKTPDRAGPYQRAFNHLGIRSLPLSKYCLAVAMLHPSCEPIRGIEPCTDTSGTDPQPNRRCRTLYSCEPRPRGQVGRLRGVCRGMPVTLAALGISDLR